MQSHQQGRQQGRQQHPAEAEGTGDAGRIIGGYKVVARGSAYEITPVDKTVGELSFRLEPNHKGVATSFTLSTTSDGPVQLEIKDITMIKYAGWHFFDEDGTHLVSRHQLRGKTPHPPEMNENLVLVVCSLVDPTRRYRLAEPDEVEMIQFWKDMAAFRGMERVRRLHHPPRKTSWERSTLRTMIERERAELIAKGYREEQLDLVAAMMETDHPPHLRTIYQTVKATV